MTAAVHYYDHYWSITIILIAHFVIAIPFSLLDIQVTWKAYAALLEGPFANSILESPFLEDEYDRLVASSMSNSDATAAIAAEDPRQTLELLGKLKDRMEENRKKFPWKSLFSKIRYSNVYTHFNM
jgi:hypothetical protein